MVWRGIIYSINNTYLLQIIFLIHFKFVHNEAFMILVKYNIFCSNEWIKNLLDGTFLSDAMTTGYHSEESCSTKYSECKIDQHTLHNLAKFIGKT